MFRNSFFCFPLRTALLGHLCDAVSAAPALQLHCTAAGRFLRPPCVCVCVCYAPYIFLVNLRASASSSGSSVASVPFPDSGAQAMTQFLRYLTDEIAGSFQVHSLQAVSR